MDDYNRGCHSKYSLKAHIIFVTKYRKKIFKSNKPADDVKQFLYDAARKYWYDIIQMETDKDHIHILLEYSPKVSVSDIVKRLKQCSTYQMWKYHESYLSKQWRLLKNTSSAKDNDSGCRVSTHLKVCDFTVRSL